MSDIEHLPEFYITDQGERVSAPVYRLLADCFLGAPGKPPGLWEAGTELQHELVPNEHMQPLNRAAGERVRAWQAGLPIARAQLSEQDIAEAAALMAPKEGEPVLEHAVWWAGVIRLATEIKLKREGRHIPAPVATAVTPLNRAVPPMTAGDFKDVVHRDQAPTGLTAMPQSARRVRAKPAPAMTTEPAQRPSDGVGQEQG